MPRFTPRFCATALAAALVLGMSATATAADDFPSKPITLVVPYTPGGTNDIVARLLAQKLGDSLGKPVIVENKAGASGNIGAEQVGRAKPDGYSMVLVTTGHAIAPSIYKDMRYDIRRDLAPVSQLTSGPLVVMVNPQLPIKSVQDLIAQAKAKPGSLNFASAGNGSSTHLATEMLDRAAGIKMTHIPYGGSSPAMTDVMAGNAQVVMDLMFSGLPNVQSGKLRAIAVTGKERSPVLPDVPTVAESGVPDFHVEAWNGLMVPAGTPQPIVDRLNAEIRKALASEDLKKRLEGQGFRAHWSTPADFGTLVSGEVTRWGGVVKQADVTIQ